jgi:hypothetical protein
MSDVKPDGPIRPSVRYGEYDDAQYEAICADVAHRLAITCVHMGAAEFDALVRQICGRKFRWLEPRA